MKIFMIVQVDSDTGKIEDIQGTFLKLENATKRLQGCLENPYINYQLLVCNIEDGVSHESK